MPKVLAMILAGGRVDELGVLTHLRPKSTVPFGGLYRIIDFPLSNLMNSGIERAGILCQYRSTSLIEHIGTGAAWDMVGRHRGVKLLPPFRGLKASDGYKGTADAVYQNLDFVLEHRPDLVLIISGDHIYRMDYRRLIEFHVESGAEITAAFVSTASKDLSRFGTADIASERPEGGRVLYYGEKLPSAHSPWISMTVYLFELRVLVRLLERNAREESHEFGRDILPRAVEEHRFFGFRHEDYWAYARTLEEYWQANMDLLGDEPALKVEEWGVRTNLDHEAVRDRGPAVIARGASVKDSRFYSGVHIEGHVERSILFPGVSVGKGARVRDSIIFFDTQIGPGARVERTIADIGVTIGKDAEVGSPHGPLTTLGSWVQVGRGAAVSPGSAIPPENPTAGPA